MFRRGSRIAGLFRRHPSQFLLLTIALNFFQIAAGTQTDPDEVPKECCRCYCPDLEMEILFCDSEVAACAEWEAACPEYGCTVTESCHP